MGERRFGKRTYDRPRDDAPRRFSRERAPQSRPSGGRDSDRFQKRDSDRFQRRDQEQSFEQRMYPATCAACNQQCEIPFRPREGKPVYCSSCFRREGDNGSRRPVPADSGLEQINRKLDKIMRALDIQS